ncbi:MAG: phosphopyruvate hydratase [Candidatus Babeliales bacterium]
MKIRNVFGREILDSRGFPTVQCTIELDNNMIATASVPSGASTGSHEAHELRDNDTTRFLGKGVLKAVENIATHIKPLLLDKEPDVTSMDNAMIACDGTENLSRLGANAILAASIAITRVQAMSQELEVYALLNKHFEFSSPSMPTCMFNIINGGLHADSGIAVQEFMIIPVGSQSIQETLEKAVAVYYALKTILTAKGYATSVGDEGGFAPRLTPATCKETAALDLLMEAITKAGFTTEQIKIGLDCAASNFFDATHNIYRLNNQELTSDELVAFYETLIATYPIISIEDGLAEDDWNGWQVMTKRLGNTIQIIGDDLFVTNTNRIKCGINAQCANATLIKPNQIGTVSKTIEAINLCQAHGYKTVISHRSGETNDAFIADLAVGTGAGQLKAGAPVRGERVAKYNRLLDIQPLL